MPNCTKCGKEVSWEDSFCAGCGASLISESIHDQKKRKEEYVGKVKKCPACGEAIQSFVAFCPTCGHEMNSTEVSESLIEFIAQIDECDRRISNNTEVPKRGWVTWGKAKKICWVLLNLYFACIPLLIYIYRTDKTPNLTTDEKRKATIIQNYAFPKERGALLEALLYVKSKVVFLATEKATANNIYWTNLWTSKAEHLYKQAELLFPGDPIAKRTYEEIINGRKAMKKKRKKRFLFGTFVVVCIFVLLAIKGGTVEKIKNMNTPLVIPETELSLLLPQIEDGKGAVVTNNSSFFTVEYYGISESDFEAYKKMCIEKGFIIDCENTGSLFDAFNEDGYNIRVTYYDLEMHVSIEDKKDMGAIVWPNTKASKQIPVPKSNYGQIYSSDTTYLIAYIGNTTKEEYKEYVYECMKKGFDIDSSQTETHFHAENKKGYYISVEYRGFDTMYINIDK